MAENPTRGAIVVPLAESLYKPYTKSITRRGRDVVSVKITGYGNIGTNFDVRYYGDKISWDVLKITSLIFGSSTVIKYSKPIAGYVYRYDIANGVFQVIDNTSKIIENVKTDEISKFGISFDIFSSKQFYLYYGVVDGSSRMHKFAQAQKNRVAEKKNDFDKSYVDEYGYGRIDVHNIFSVMIVEYVFWENLSNQLFEVIEEARNPVILRSNAHLKDDIIGDYSIFANSVLDNCVYGKMVKLRKSDVYRYYELLLSLVWMTITNRGNHVYEPWMLWEMWKWIGMKTPEPGKYRIFDISPNWSI